MCIRDSPNDSDRREQGKWKVTIQTELSVPTCGTLCFDITDPSGRETYSCERRVCGKSDKLVFYIDGPRLWDILTPNLYSLSATLCAEDGPQYDCVQTKFGFRTTKFDPKEGFLLNGIRLKLNGVCMHHDLGALGAAVNYDATYRQLSKMKELSLIHI